MQQGRGGKANQCAIVSTITVSRADDLDKPEPSSWLLGSAFFLLLACSPLFILLPDCLHVLPYIPLKLRVSQKKGGVVGGHEPGAVVGVELASEDRDALRGLQQGLGGEGPQGADDLGSDGVQLLAEEGEAGLDLIGLRVAVLRRAAFYDVGDVDLFSREVYGLDDTGKELPCLADKGPPLQVLFPARGFSHKDDHGMGIPFAKDHALSALMEPAPGTIPHFSFDSIEAQGCAGVPLREEGIDP
jgi:hypothetical protein